MKYIHKLLFLVLLLPVTVLVSCQDDEYELGGMLDPSQIKYQIVQDLEADPGGNTVILINETPGTVPIWDYGTGRSNRMVDTVRFAFKGDYPIKLSIMTAGGVVEMEPKIMKVTEDNLMYVNDPLWTALTGGVGEEKTWILDNGEYGLATGPLAYASPSGTVEFRDFTPNWEPQGSDIGATEADYGAEMTFSLEGGPFFTAIKPNEEGGEESGTYFLNASEKTLSITDGTIIRPATFIPNAANWNENLKILELTDNQLQIAVLRTNEEGPWWYILNYVEKEYAENYVPVDQPDPNFDHGDQGDLLAVDRTTTKTWVLDPEVPYNWADLEGNLLNEWNSRADIIASGWAPYGDEDVENIDNASISFSEDGTVVVKQDDGTTQEGTYSIDERTNIITFEGVQPVIPIAGWVSTATTEENQWKILKVERNAMDKVSGIWFGQRSTDKDEYMVFHFLLQSGGNAGEDPVLKMIEALTGSSTGESSRTFKIDTEWPVDWTDLQGEGGWTQPGSQADPANNWYWDAETEASVADQRLTFSLENGAVTVTKLDAEGNTTSSPVELNAEDMLMTIPETNIIQFGGVGAWLPTAGPEYKWVRGSFANVTTNGFWIGVKTPDKDEYTIYHYIVE